MFRVLARYELSDRSFDVLEHDVQRFPSQLWLGIIVVAVAVTVAALLQPHARRFSVRSR